MLEAMLPAGHRAQATARILSWMIQVDERPLLVEGVILWVSAKAKGTATSYHLAQLYRHPLRKPPEGKRWHIWMTSHLPPGKMTFQAPPTLADLDRLLGLTNWEFDASSGFTLVDGHVCAGAWRESFGTAPSRSFP